ncbi:MAG: pilus assembly protein [Sphingomonadales bacterium]|nr:pilus assembly protein [Sphingomonadales bacterium]
MCKPASSQSNWLRRVRRKIARDRSGQALVEAALVFPIFISLFLGISEFSEGFTLRRRLEAAANTSADLVARVRSLRTAELNAIKPMIDEIIKPFPNTTLSLVITSVVADETNTTRVAWSHAQGPGVSARAEGAAVVLPVGLTEPNTSIVFTEVRYVFRSTLGSMIIGNLPFQADAYMRPRLSGEVEKLD